MTTEVEEEVVATASYSYDDEFQLRLTALYLRDGAFAARVESLVKPEYMTSHIDGVLIKIVQDYYAKYRIIPSIKILSNLIVAGVSNRTIRKDDVADIKERLTQILAEDLADAEYITDEIVKFARHQAMEQAIFTCAELVDKGKFEKIETVMREALNIGVAEEANRVDYWNTIDARSHIREEILAGRIKPEGITTGHREIDDLLYHKGWGRKELTVLMGPAKSGKSMSLIGFAAAAAKAGYNVAYFSLEVSNQIIADRIDAHVSRTAMKDLSTSIGLVSGRVSRIAATAGALDLFEFPTGTLSPGDVRRIVSRKAAEGLRYDLIVVDYADLMRPNHLSNEPRENSRTIYVDLRAIAVEFNIALLSATQTNREGFKAAAGKMEHVAEDINKARTVDLLLSLNATEDEKARGEARIYFAASRNQRSDMVVTVKTEIDKATYIAGVTGISSSV